MCRPSTRLHGLLRVPGISDVLDYLRYDAVVDTFTAVPEARNSTLPAPLSVVNKEGKQWIHILSLISLSLMLW